MCLGVWEDSQLWREKAERVPWVIGENLAVVRATLVCTCMYAWRSVCVDEGGGGR